jgi:hypothetical protein
VILSAFASTAPMTRRVWISAGLAAGAFAIWSLSVPMNGWQSFHVVAAHKGALAVAGALAGTLFNYFAEGVTTRIPD